MDFIYRVKNYCSICYPNVDNLTQTQLKRMKKCRHGKRKFYLWKLKINISYLALINNEPIPEDIDEGGQIGAGTITTPAAIAKDKSKNPLL